MKSDIFILPIKITFLISLSVLNANCGTANTVTPFPVVNLVTRGFHERVEQTLAEAPGTLLQGSVQLFGIEDCNDSSDVVFQTFKSCFGTNPAAPYILPLLPTRAGEFVDSNYNNILSESVNGERSSAVFRVSNDDASIVVLKLPSRAAYFGFQSYLFTRFEQGNSKPSANPDRIDIFGSIGNAINNRVIEQQNGAAWDQNIVVITSANPTLADKLKERLVVGGIKSEQIFIEPVGTLVKTGLESEADELVTLIRFALPEDPLIAETWRQSLKTHVKVLRWIEAQPTQDTFPDPLLAARTSNSEQNLANAQVELMDLLRAGLLVPALPRPRNFIVPGFLVGPECIAKGNNCLGDSQDTDTYRYYSVGKMSQDHHLMVVGVNPVQTGNAAYTSLAVQNADLLAGILSKSQVGGEAGFVSGELLGSAKQMLVDSGQWNNASPELQSKIDSFYSVVVSRNCLVIGVACTEISAAALPLDSSVSLLRRAYLKEGSLHGADPADMLSPIGVDWKN